MEPRGPARRLPGVPTVSTRRPPIYQIALVALLVALALSTATPAAAGVPDPETGAGPIEVAQEPGPAFRDGDGIGGGGPADPASPVGTVAFLVSSVTVVAVIVGGIFVSRRRRGGQSTAEPLGRSNDAEPDQSQEKAAP